MTSIYNFAAGPAMLPEPVLLRAKNELLDWQGTGVSIMEIGHRTSIFQNMLLRLEEKLRSLIGIPSNYRVLFLPGGAQAYFSLIPMNLTKKNKNADYFISGIWSKRAAEYAKRYVNVNIVTTANSVRISESTTWNLNSTSAYVYYCSNETINGICFPDVPQVGDVPLVADMTSSILSETVDVSKFGVIFASAQKNLGIAGITLLIIRDDLLDLSTDNVPEIFNFKLQAENKSLLNTIPTFPVYMMDLMVDWVIQTGGVKHFATMRQVKSGKLYQCIDKSNFYINTVDPLYRSQLNIPFNLPNESLLELFLEESGDLGLRYLKGHSLVGGARASLYNAMSEDGVDKLVDFMNDFVQRYSKNHPIQ